MSEWKEYKLGDVVEKFIDYRGKTPIKTNIGIPLITAKIIKNGRLLNATEFIAPENYDNWMTRGFPEINDVLLTSEAPLGEVALVRCKKIALGQRIITLHTKDNICNSIFLKYYLQSAEGQGLLQSRASGSTVEGIKAAELKQISINLPCISEQKEVAGILSSLDDKIDLLNRENKTLEAMAETLFRKWFVEDAKKDWKEGKLGDLTTVKRGGSPRPINDYLSDKGLRWLKISDITNINSPFIFEIKEHIKQEGLTKTTFLKKGSLVLSNSATPGIPKILQVDSCIHDGWLYFQQSKLSNEFLYLFFKFIRPELECRGNGSIFTNLKTDILREFPIRIPDDYTLMCFDSIIKSNFAKMKANTIQIHLLNKLRETTLQKLMSGEISIKK